MSATSYLPLFMLMSMPPIIVVLYISLSLLIAFLGINKKMGFWGIFFFSIIFSPILGLIVLVISGNRKDKRKEA